MHVESRGRRGLPQSRRAVAIVAAATLLCACTGGDSDGGQEAAPDQAAPTSSSSSEPTASSSGSAPSTPPPTAGIQHPAEPTSWGPTRGEYARAKQIVSGFSDRELVGQLFVAAYPGTAAPVDLVREYHLGGVIAFSENVASVADIAAANRRLQAAAAGPWPLVVSVDQEGGTVARLGPPMTQFPAYMSAGAADDPAVVQQAAKASGAELRAAGFTMVFAPDADVTIGPADPTIGSRSAGSRPELVARTVAASLAGYRRAGIAAVVKHFPGHGSVTADSHLGLPRQDATLAELRRRDLIPFERAVDAGASAVMVAHIAVEHVAPGVPADLSRKVTGLLTGGMGFDGLVVTDALNMGAVTDAYTAGEAAVAAIRAGADVLLTPVDVAAAYAGVLDALRSGDLARERLERSAAKIGALMLSVERRPSPPPSIWGSHRGISVGESTAAATVVVGSCRGPYVGDSVRVIGDDELVGGFERAAAAAGLATGSGPVVALMTSSPPGAADVAVSLDTPYVLAAAAAPTKIAMYGTNAEAMRALVLVLTGEAMPLGRLPVSIPGLEPKRCG